MDRAFEVDKGIAKEIYNKGRADAIDEFINAIKPRLDWDNYVYTFAIEHCIEVAKQLKESNKCSQ